MNGTVCEVRAANALAEIPALLREQNEILRDLVSATALLAHIMLCENCEHYANAATGEHISELILRNKKEGAR